jgi:hypothetical protein
MSVILIAGVLLVLACLAYVILGPGLGMKEGFQDTEPTITEEVATPPVAAPMVDKTGEVVLIDETKIDQPSQLSAATMDASAKEQSEMQSTKDELTVYKDLRTQVSDALAQVDRAGGPEMVKKRLADQTEADAFDTAMLSMNSVLNMIPESITPEIASQMRAKGIDIVQFEPLLSGQVSVIQKALATPVKAMAPAAVARKELPPPTGEAVNVIADELSNLLEENNGAVPTEVGAGDLTEGFATYQNPYNGSSSTQSYQFALGKQALIRSILG